MSLMYSPEGKDIFRRCVSLNTGNENISPSTRLPIQIIPSLLDCNTYTYIQRLHAFTSSQDFSHKEIAFMYSIYLEQLKLSLNVNNEDNRYNIFSEKIVDYIVKHVSIDFRAPFIDNLLLNLSDAYVFDDLDYSQKDTTNIDVCNQISEDTIDGRIDAFFSEFYLSIRKLPTSAALLEMAERRERDFCGRLNEEVDKKWLASSSSK